MKQGSLAEHKLLWTINLSEHRNIAVVSLALKGYT